MKCDLCGKPVASGWDLSELVSHYQTEEVKEVCRECLREANTVLAKFQELSRKFTRRGLKRYLRAKKKGGGM